MPFALAAVYLSVLGAPRARTVASVVAEQVLRKAWCARATCVSSDPATIAPMSSERMIAARRRTGSGSGFDTASAAHWISLTVLAAACARAEFSLAVMSCSLRVKLSFRVPKGKTHAHLASKLYRSHRHAALPEDHRGACGGGDGAGRHGERARPSTRHLHRGLRPDRRDQVSLRGHRSRAAALRRGDGGRARRLRRA